MHRPTKTARYIPELITIYARNIELQTLKRGWSARRLADEVGVTPPALARVRRCHNKVIDPELLAALMRVFDCSPNDLLQPHPDVDYSSPSP